MAEPGIIFFDAGGTLLDPWPSVGAIYAEVAAEFGLALDAGAAQGAFERSFVRCRDAAYAGRRLIFGASEADARRFWRGAVEGMFDELGGRPDCLDSLFGRLYGEFARAERYRPLPGALETIDALRARGWRVGLISNWDHRLRGILAGLGLTPRLDPVVISSEVALEKPDTAIFRCALARAGLESHQAVMVGDSFNADVKGAAEAGLRGVLLDREGWSTGRADRIRSLPDLLALLHPVGTRGSP